ncbi:L-lactate permease, partial [Brucella melitensis]|uniref:L-lactate permease n=1 Tax=Brucella melitensis TaxID=29459 RepID=UPI001FD5BC8B
EKPQETAATAVKQAEPAKAQDVEAAKPAQAAEKPIQVSSLFGYVTRYSGTDATLGLAFAQTGWVYPFFGAMLGWLGVALTGS